MDVNFDKDSSQFLTPKQVKALQKKVKSLETTVARISAARNQTKLALAAAKSSASQNKDKANLGEFVYLILIISVIHI